MHPIYMGLWLQGYAKENHEVDGDFQNTQKKKIWVLDQ